MPPLFSFLEGNLVELQSLGNAAWLSYEEDSNASMVKLRQYGESILKIICDFEKIPQPNSTIGQFRKIEYLKDNSKIPNDILVKLHLLRELGNLAVHEMYSSKEDAIFMLKTAYELGIWLVQVYEGILITNPFKLPGKEIITETNVGAYQKEISDLKVRLDFYKKANPQIRIYKDMNLEEEFLRKQKEEEETKKNNSLRALVRLGDKTGFINGTGKTIILDEYYSLSYSEGIMKAQVGESFRKKTFYLDSNGFPLINSNYVDGFDFSEGLASVKNKSGKWGYINSSGNIVIEFKFDEATSFSEGLAGVEQDVYEYGFINRTGDYIINPISGVYSVDSFKEGFCGIRFEDEEGRDRAAYIDRSGSIVFSLDGDLYSDNDIFVDGVAAVGCVDEYQLIDKRGRFITDQTYYNAPRFSEGKAFVKYFGESNKYNFIDRQGTPLLKKQGFNVRDGDNFSEGLAPILLDDSWVYINHNYDVVLETDFDECLQFKNGFAPFKLNNKWGFINKAGKVCIDPIYDYALYFV